jgi:hypothetical protein
MKRTVIQRMNQCDGAKEQRLACAVIRKMEPRCQQGLSGLLLSGGVINTAQRPLPHNTQNSQELCLTTHNILKNSASQHTTFSKTLPHNTQHSQELCLTTHNILKNSASQHTTFSRTLPHNTQHSQQTYLHAPGGIRTPNPSKQAAADPRLRALAHTPAFCWNRIRLRSWSFSHVPALPLAVVSLILNAARERCLYIEIGVGFVQTEVCKTVVRHRQV